MTTFIIACAGLVLLSGLFYLFPARRRGGADADMARANLESFRLREAELSREGSAVLQDDARLRLLEDEQQQAQVDRAASEQSFPVWILLPLVALVSAGLYYKLGAAPDVLIVRQLENVSESSSEQDMQRLMAQIQNRSAQRPDNLHYAALLGRYYMGQQDYTRAAQTYGALAVDAPQDAQALAYAAQAEYLASGRTLNDKTRMKAEQALAIDPHQRTALGLLGMASFEQQKYRAAIEYWQRLLVMETPDSESAQMIASVIATAQQRLGEGGLQPAPAPTAPAATAVADTAVADTGVTTAGVTVRVALPAQARFNPGDTVFILARNAESDSRMPIAVKRLQASQLPITLRLDDSNSMAGQKLSATESVLVLVQVSPDGRPGEANASWLGQAGPLAPSLDTAPLDILLYTNGS
ncbi:MAG: c-type cytochrome biogenesis protein CcmI [Halioglobus sp.]